MVKLPIGMLKTNKLWKSKVCINSNILSVTRLQYYNTLMFKYNDKEYFYYLVVYYRTYFFRVNMHIAIFHRDKISQDITEITYQWKCRTRICNRTSKTAQISWSFRHPGPLATPPCTIRRCRWLWTCLLEPYWK